MRTFLMVCLRMSVKGRCCGFGSLVAQYFPAQRSTVQYSTVQYSTVQLSTAQHITVQYTVRSSTVAPALSLTLGHRHSDGLAGWRAD